MGKISKVVICGSNGVGKTSILEQAIYGKITKYKVFPTIEDIYVANIETERGTKEKMRLYETVDPTMNPNLMGSDGYILVYDPTKMETLEWIMALKRDIDKMRDKKEIAVIVLGNHFEPKPDSTVISSASNWVIKERLRMFDVSALERSSLYEGFVYLCSKLNPQPVKSGFPQLSMRKRE